MAGVSADQVTNFQVKIRLLRESYQDLIPADNPAYSPFRPGMSTTVDIQTETEADVLTIPIQAVTTRSDSTGKVVAKKIDKDKFSENKDENKKVDIQVIEYVFIYENGEAKMLPVKSGIQNNTYIQILEGLDAGQEIIVGPYRAVSRTLKNGEKVEKVSKEELFSEE